MFAQKVTPILMISAFATNDLMMGWVCVSQLFVRASVV